MKTKEGNAHEMLSTVHEAIACYQRRCYSLYKIEYAAQKLYGLHMTQVISRDVKYPIYILLIL